jgi:omega-6 fatty acid desaturase (delta-12 desaturase)
MRFPSHADRPAERFSVRLTNLAIVLGILVAILTIGMRTFLIIQLPITAMAASAGVWLFYVQHQFEGVYWTRHADWEPMRAALAGSSYYRLPALLRWFTGNIGLHFIHHIMPRIPNYKLQPCYDAIAGLQTVKPISLRASLRFVRLNLWDEGRRQLVSFRSLLSTKYAGTTHTRGGTALAPSGKSVTPPFWW